MDWAVVQIALPHRLTKLVLVCNLKNKILNKKQNIAMTISVCRVHAKGTEMMCPRGISINVNDAKGLKECP